VFATSFVPDRAGAARERPVPTASRGAAFVYAARMTTLVLTVLGDDRAGLVNALADIVADHGGNWERSQMAELAGKFAGIVVVTVPEGRRDELVAALEPLDGMLDVTVQVGASDHVPSHRVRLELMGTDRPGIVREISQVLSGLDVSIEELITGTRDAPMAGGVLFEADAVLEVPAGLTHEALRQALEAVANELMVDLELEDLA
jgi:glycine cleavage system regulatory protein